MVALLAGEPAALEVQDILRRRPPPSICAVNLAEVVDWMIRVGRREPDIVRERIDWLLVGGLEVEPVALGIARLAGQLRAAHYHKAARAVSVADCLCLATAVVLETDLATTDPALAQVARAAGVAVVALPDSTGSVP